MLGFKPSNQRNKKKPANARRRKGLQYKASGGLIEGPGSGTSDDIKAVMPAGSYIMPADSTKQIGPENLSEIGSPMDVRVSNGEYQMPPEQVHALGAQVLEQIKDETHTPAAQGFQPDVNRNGEQFFNQGGLIEGPDELKRRAAAANRPALPAPEARPALPPPQAQPAAAQPQATTAKPQPAHSSGAQNTAFNNHGRGDYTAADQARARARADGASWQAERAAQDAKFQKASTAQPQAKPRGFVSGAASQGRKVLNAGGRLAPGLAAADAIAPSLEQDSTARYAERFGVSEPTGDGSFGDIAKFSALRAGGFASDLGNTLTFGQAGRLYRDKQREAAEGESPYTEKVPNAAAVAGGYAGSKAGQLSGKGVDIALKMAGKGTDAALRVGSRGRYNKNYAENLLTPKKVGAKKALGFVGAAGGGTAAHNYTSNLMSDNQQGTIGSTITEPANLTAPALPVEQPPATANERVQPAMVDGVPTFTNEHAAQIDPSRINTMPSSSVMAPSSQQSAAVSEALRAAADRGDWAAIQNHYAKQGQSFGGLGAGGLREPGAKVNVIRDTTRAPSNAEILHQRMAAGQQNRDLEERRLGFDMQTAQARQALLERNQNMQETLSLPQLRSAAQIENLYQMLEQAQSEEERSSIAEQISQLQSGSRSQKDNYITLGGGQVWDEQAQSMVNQPQQLFDIRNQQIVSAGNQLPPLAQNPQAQAIIADGKKSREQKALELRQMGYSIDLSKFQ